MLDPSEVDLLVVDDDDEFRATVMRRFSRRGFCLHESNSAEAALEIAARRQFDVAIFDMVMPGLSGIELLERFKTIQPECEVVMLTGQGSIETAVEAMKLGAFDYLSKPFPLGQLEVVVERAFDRRRLQKENDQLRTLLSRKKPSDEMIGDSPAMREVRRLIERAAPSDKAILIQGESGTGKELVARALHRQSARAEKQLVVINCAALSEMLLESELFGHEKGSFTGAISAKPGLFEVADGGTLFIDEIGEMPGALQAKLLRVLEDGSMRRVGSLKERRVNVRLLAATNRDLTELVEQGKFRQDLLFRINVMSVDLPPLRDRNGDLSLLIGHFLGIGWGIEPAAEAALLNCRWPGNVRQLQNAIERAKILADDKVVRARDLPPEVTSNSKSIAASLPAADELATIERAKIVEVLRRENGNKARAARTLRIDRRRLYRLLDKYSIGKEEIAAAT